MPEFYRTVFWIEVLSEGAYNPSTLSDIAYDIGEGDCVGAFGEEYRTQLSSEEMAEALTEMGSDPSFFGIEEKPVRDIGDWIREEEERNLD